MRIIPAIDMMNGKCVRLSKGDFATKKIYSENPLEMALMFEAAGLRYLHLVDLDGARAQHTVNHKILHAIASKTALHIDFGGGIKTGSDVQRAFDFGASQVTVGSIAATAPGLLLQWLEQYGPEKIILGADCHNREIVTAGWLNHTGKDVIDFIDRFAQKGIRYVTCTDVARDGMLNGPSITLYKEILSKISISLIASGGVTAMNDLRDLQQAGCEAVIIGKAIYEERITLEQLSALC